MNDVLEKLLILQDRDAKLARLTAELDRIPVERGDLDRQEQSATDTADQAKAEGKRIEVERKRLEMEVGSKEELVRKYKGQLIAIKNNDQFHALQHEITNAEQEIRRIEDQELVLMEKNENAQSTSKQADAALQETKKRLEMQRKELAQKELVVQKQAGEIRSEREKLAAEVDEDTLGRYDRILKSKHGQAIVRISHGLCMGCHLKLTAQEVHRAQADSELVTCTNCGRILYWMAE